jgi:uncharacterized protein (TIGR00369 family)
MRTRRFVRFPGAGPLQTGKNLWLDAVTQDSEEPWRSGQYGIKRRGFYNESVAILEKDEWLARIREAHTRTALGALGGEVIDVDEDHLVLRMSITEKSLQPYGLLHGGISLFLVETAASSHAAFGIDLDEKVPVGIEVSGSHVRSATKGTLKAFARVLRRGNTHIVHDVEILLEETGEVLCKGRMTNYYKPVGSKPGGSWQKESL